MRPRGRGLLACGWRWERRQFIAACPRPALLPSPTLFPYKPRRTARRIRAAVAVSFARNSRHCGPVRRIVAISGAYAPLESQMPKLKTKSGAKKRFKISGTGKVIYAQRGKRHGMIKRTNKQIRNLRGTAVLFKTDGDNVKKYFLPNG